MRKASLICWTMVLTTIFTNLPAHAIWNWVPKPLSPRTGRSSELAAKQVKLQNARRILKEEFVGIDPQIDRVIDTISTWYLLPEAQERPLIINLWGMTGVGKTSLIRRLIDLIEFRHAYGEVDIGEVSGNSRDGNTSGLAAVYRFSAMDGRPMVWNLDEFHTGRTIHEQGFEIDRPGLRPIFQLLSDGIVPIPIGKKELFQSLKSIVENTGIMSSNGYLGDAEMRNVHRFLFPKMTYEELQLKLGNDVKKKDRAAFAASILPRFEAEMPFEKPVNFKRSLIFVSGNLDEAYSNVSQMDPTLMSADEFYESSRTVRLGHIKRALSARFRLEQIARLGNIHVIYPSFSGEGFRLLIRNELKRLAHFAEAEVGAKIEFSEAVVNLIYDEGVIPSQGARPVLSTLGEVVAARLSEWLVQAITKDQPVAKIFVDVIDGPKILATGLTGAGGEVFNYQTPVELRAGDRLKVEYSERQRRIAYRVAGTVISGAFALRRLPTAIYSKADSSLATGFARFAWPALPGQKDYESQLRTLLAGRAAESIIYGADNVSSAVGPDIQYATELSGRMVQNWGMGSHISQSSDLKCSTAFNTKEHFQIEDACDQEKLLAAADAENMTVLGEQKALLEALAAHLSHTATIARKDLLAMFEQHLAGDHHELLANLKQGDCLADLTGED